MSIAAANKQQAMQRVTLIGALINLVLGLAKTFAGWLFHSHALVADGIHSLSDLLTDVMVLVITRIAHQGPDHNHPYGHERFETLGTVVLGTILIAVAGAIGYDSLMRLTAEDSASFPTWPALAVTLASILGKEWLYHYTRRAGERLGSELMVANAWHHRSDALSSIVVLIALIGSLAGFVWMDALAAALVAVMVAHIGWKLCWSSLQELTDTGLPSQELRQIRHLMLDEEGVHSVHDLRTRKMGANFLLDVHLVVDDELTAAEAHHVGLRATQRVRDHYEQVKDIVFHIDVLADERAQLQLPSRSTIQAWLAPQLQPQQLQLLHLKLYYLQRKIRLELYFPLHQRTQAQALAQQILHSPPAWLADIQLWFNETD
ncbi:cation diffusion facilitator family transporter [Balneatrix alpica]|uniref:Cation diffusion facilitator family transporter n=1 Tax=Balneatrix alpica TaxID=75684 RepID=A0ABV5Z7V3_9GAMM|nr:cation diffusion facilitator family transporter [Balneatrix alpica]